MNGKTQHTPGPWHAVGNYGDIMRAGSDNEHPVAVCRMHTEPSINASRPTREEWRANARLIAAAPDLLAALETIWHNLSSLRSAYPDGVRPSDLGGTQDIARAAIARARGESNERASAQREG